MDFLPVISGLIDLAKKADEYDDEKGSLVVTLQTLMETVENLNKSCDISDNDPLIKRAKKQLEEAKELLASAPKSLSMFKRVISVLNPSLDMSQKLKEMNSSISQTVQLLNHKLIAGMHPGIKSGMRTLSEDPEYLRKRVLTNTDTCLDDTESYTRLSTRSRTAGPPVMQATLLDDDPLMKKTQLDDGPTQLDNDDGGSVENWAFELTLFLEDEVTEMLRKSGNPIYYPPELVKWDGKDEVSYIVGREKLAFLPDVCRNRVSREHCTVVARRTPQEGNTKRYQYRFSITDTSGNGTFFFVVDDRGRHQNTKLKKNQPECLQDGQRIGIAAKPPSYDKMLVGFSFKTFENVPQA